MKIGQKKRTTGDNRFHLVAVVIALAFIAGVVVGNGQTAAAVLDAIPALVAPLFSSAPAAPSLPVLTIDMDFTAYNTILDQRQTALAEGVFIATENDFVPAEMHLDEETAVPVRMRLLQGPARSLGDNDKWPFDVRTRDNGRLLEMDRFTLQDAASNNWLYQWAFARSLQRAGLLAADYYFVRLIFNGDDRGIYALQEGFGETFLVTHDRPAGVIVEFDAHHLWQSIRHFGGDIDSAYADPITNLAATDFRYFEVDTFRDATLANDPELSAQKDNAIGLLRAFQAGEAEAAAIFDVEKYGQFLALVDFWGANEALALVNLRYYYRPQDGRLEPIGYSGNPLASGDRIDPASIYNDPQLQAAYVQAALRVSEPAYLEQLQADLEAEWQQLQQALVPEVAQPLPWEALRQRQEAMRRSLNPVQPVFAYLGPPALASQAVIQVDVANILNLPLEIVGFDIGGATFLEADAAWIQGDAVDLLVQNGDGRLILRGREASPALRYVRFHLPLVEIQRHDSELDYLQAAEIMVATRIVGRQQPQLTPAREGYPPPVLPADSPD